MPPDYLRPGILDIPASALVIPFVAVVVLLWRWRHQVSSRKAGLPLPPGPRRLPIIGNLLDIPMRDIEVRFRDLNTQYGT